MGAGDDPAGTPREEVPALAAAILRLAGPPGPPVSVQAAQLARTSPYSARAWQDALDIIGDGADLIPGADPAALLQAVTRLAGRGYHPAACAHHLVAACLYVAPAPRTRWQRLRDRAAGPWRCLAGWWQLRGWTRLGATDDDGEGDDTS